ncbi:ATP-binding protein [Pricia sp. S334]|uniref:histidine kinase n=1 Tax=Pricia mediterranea TaxID=3076079 RepID=A0ABU3L3Z7_9FLAO|nr:ATP-binding protein [Pricia sp. S334]MDT7827978.1 ATP-binding protein [Pricia sp. S334]
MISKRPDRVLNFLEGGGEMGQIIRDKNWASTELGIPENWPLALKFAIGTMLKTAFPNFIFWGKDYRCFYNDAYRPSLGIEGKHPFILGQKAEDAWPEIIDTIKPLLDSVWETGEPTWSENQLIPFYRNGRIENIYWTFSYSALINDDGAIGGILTTCAETTEAVENLQKLELREKNLKNKSEQLQLALDVAEMAIWEMDPQTKIAVGDERFRKWHGLPQTGDFNLEESMDRIPAEHRETIKNALDQSTSNTHGRLDIEYPIYDPETEKERIVRAKGRTRFDQEGCAVRTIGVLQDISEIVRARTKLENFSKKLENQVAQRTMELQDANTELTLYLEKLKRTNTELESFAYVSSHDLKEPLRKIQMYTSRIQEPGNENLSDTDKKYFAKIIGAASRMRALIDDLLAFSRTDVDQADFAPTDLNTILAEVLDDLSVEIERKGASINSDQLPTVESVPFQMRQVFGNLLSNALKFARDARPKVKITAEVLPEREVEELGWHAEGVTYHKVSIEDNGIGFAEGMETKIFEVFQRLHGKSDFEGTGIGLSIVKKIIDNHNGVISADSVEGKGSTFTIIIPEIHGRGVQG